MKTAAMKAGETAALRAGDQPGQFSISGALSFDTVIELLSQGTSLLEKGLLEQGDTTIDLTGVTQADSAGLALLIEWLRQARQRGGRLRYTGVPRQLQALAGISDVESLLGVSTSA